MLERLRGVQGVVLRPFARLLLRLGVHPDAVTWFGALSVTVTALVCFGMGWLWQGALAVAVLSCSDMIDGHMARESGSAGRWGGFLDATLDRVADAGVIGGLAWHLGLRAGSAWAVLAVVALVLAQATSYVKARAEAINCQADVGLVTRADRIALALLGALLGGLGVPYALEVAVVLLVLGGAITVVQRLVAVRRQLRSPASAPASGPIRVRT
ncbi:phosphatidylinositol phosphate synthase [Granulicoccus sp. GXG6511]|uniref:phosphatidylinositol phosphate synthase n=1 Tax=Granulicoccus sp. GXG6511 TaxID=3381351 RepID=UPI003D7E9404